LVGSRRHLIVHACYADLSAGSVDRDAYTITHFQSWVDWCNARRLGINFDPCYFSHSLAGDGLTLAHPDNAIRRFRINCSITCRKIGEEIARQISSPVVTNVWIPDGSKDMPYDRKSPRERLAASLDEIFAAQVAHKLNLDAVKIALFGIDSQSSTSATP
jgi:L-rhamnose isomerase